MIKLLPPLLMEPNSDFPILRTVSMDKWGAARKIRKHSKSALSKYPAIMKETDSHNRSWYLIYTKPRNEQKAFVHLNEQGYETYLPRCQIIKRRQSRQITVTEAMFPNYLFIRLDNMLDNWAPIRSTPGVNKLVRFGLNPAQVPQIFIDRLKQNEDEDGLQKIASLTFSRGDKVRLLDGPMAGLEAIYQTAKGSDRAMIMLNILGKLTQVELDPAGLGRI